MGVIKKVSAPVKVAQKATVTRAVVKAATTVAPGGFNILKGVEIPAKRAFGRRGILNELFTNLVAGDCVEIPVDADKKIVSKMNAIYNAARKAGDIDPKTGKGVGASVVMRVHEAGDANGLGGVIRLWFNGFYNKS